MTNTATPSTPAILVIKLGALGDFIQAAGAMKAIRVHHTNAKITLLTTKPFVKMAEACGYFDEIWIDTKPKFYQYKEWKKLRHKLNYARFSRVYDLQNNDRTAIYFNLFSPKPQWVGVAKGASHRNNAPDRTAGHAFDGHVQTLGLAGIQGIEVDTLDWAKGNLDGFNLQKPFIVIAAGSAPDRLEKRWPAHYYGELALDLYKAGYQPVLIGTIAEIDVNQKILNICPQALDLTAKTTLFDIVELGRGAVACIGNDTGPIHMMAPTGCPTLVLFSRHSNPKRHYPKGKTVEIVYQDALTDLTVQEVQKKFITMLENNKR